MVFDPERHHRRSIRLPTYDYNGDGAYYVTLCIRDRLPLLGQVGGGEMLENESALIVRAVWESLPERYDGVSVDAFVVMPNHVHGVLVFGSENETDAVGAIHESPLRWDLRRTAKMNRPYDGICGVPLW